jgi:hypothetical protein
MASLGIIALALLVQIAVSAFGARRLAGRGFKVAWLSCLAVPVVILLYAIWLIFDFFGMTESGARVLLPLTVGLLVFLIVGFAASAIAYRISKKSRQ